MARWRDVRGDLAQRLALRRSGSTRSSQPRAGSIRWARSSSRGRACARQALPERGAEVAVAGAATCGGGGARSRAAPRSNCATSRRARRSSAAAAAPERVRRQSALLAGGGRRDVDPDAARRAPARSGSRRRDDHRARRSLGEAPSRAARRSGSASSSSSTSSTARAEQRPRAPTAGRARRARRRRPAGRPRASTYRRRPAHARGGARRRARRVRRRRRATTTATPAGAPRDQRAGDALGARSAATAASSAATRRSDDGRAARRRGSSTPARWCRTRSSIRSGLAASVVAGLELDQAPVAQRRRPGRARSSARPGSAASARPKRRRAPALARACAHSAAKPGVELTPAQSRSTSRSNGERPKAPASDRRRAAALAGSAPARRRGRRRSMRASSSGRDAVELGAQRVLVLLAASGSSQRHRGVRVGCRASHVERAVGAVDLDADEVRAGDARRRRESSASSCRRPARLGRRTCTACAVPADQLVEQERDALAGADRRARSRPQVGESQRDAVDHRGEVALTGASSRPSADPRRAVRTARTSDVDADAGWRRRRRPIGARARPAGRGRRPRAGGERGRDLLDRRSAR